MKEGGGVLCLMHSRVCLIASCNAGMEHVGFSSTKQTPRAPTRRRYRLRGMWGKKREEDGTGRERVGDTGRGKQ